MLKHIKLPVCLNWTTDKPLFSGPHPLSPQKQKNIDNNIGHRDTYFILNVGHTAIPLTMCPRSLGSNSFLGGKWKRRVHKPLKFKIMRKLLMTKHQLLNANKRRRITKDFVLCSGSSCCLLWEYCSHNLTIGEPPVSCLTTSAGHLVV